MSNVKLLAHAEKLSVGRRASHYAWGQWDVTLNDGEENALDDRLMNGYIYKLPTETNSGRFDRLFTRADTKQNLKDNTTDVEKNLLSVEKRVDGAVFFESDIDASGLGHFEPGRDFGTGDLVDVIVWGKTLELPVTSIQETTRIGEPHSYLVHVGGQMIQDAEALATQNDEVIRTIAQERRENEKNLSRVEKRVTIAQNTADTATTKADGAQASANAAQTTADGAKEDAATAQSTADDAMNRANSAYSYAGDVDDVLKGVNIKLRGQGLQGDITEQLAQAARTGTQSQDWINKNQAALNVLQQEWNSDVDGWRATQEKINNNRELFETAQEEINRLQEENNNQQQHILDSYLAQQKILNGRQTTYAYLDKYNASWTDGNIFLQLVDGNIQMALLDAKDETGEGRDSNLPAETTFTLYGATGNPKVFYTSNIKQQAPDMSSAGKVEKAVILINHKPGEPKYVKKNAGYRKTTSSWLAINDLTFKAPESSSYNLKFKIGFSEVRYKENIGYRIVKRGLNGTTVLADFYGRTSRDYLERKEELRMISVPNVYLSQGEVVEFQACHSGVNKEIFGAETNISYVSTNV